MVSRRFDSWFWQYVKPSRKPFGFEPVKITDVTEAWVEPSEHRGNAVPHGDSKCYWEAFYLVKFAYMGGGKLTVDVGKLKALKSEIGKYYTRMRASSSKEGVKYRVDEIKPIYLKLHRKVAGKHVETDEVGASYMLYAKEGKFICTSLVPVKIVLAKSGMERRDKVYGTIVLTVEYRSRNGEIVPKKILFAEFIPQYLPVVPLTYGIGGTNLSQYFRLLFKELGDVALKSGIMSFYATTTGEAYAMTNNRYSVPQIMANFPIPTSEGIAMTVVERGDYFAVVKRRVGDKEYNVFTFEPMKGMEAIVGFAEDKVGKSRLFFTTVLLGNQNENLIPLSFLRLNESAVNTFWVLNRVEAERGLRAVNIWKVFDEKLKVGSGGTTKFDDIYSFGTVGLTIGVKDTTINYVEGVPGAVLQNVYNGRLQIFVKIYKLTEGKERRAFISVYVENVRTGKGKFEEWNVTI